MGLIRCDVARGLSPQQIALGRAGQIGASPSTIYRWISRGYAGMCDLDLRRKCGVSVNTFFTMSANVSSPIAPP